MVKYLVLALGLTVGLLGFVATASADPKLDWHKQVSQKNCDTAGKKIIDVEQKVLNDVDSGFGGNNWAFDNLQRKIEVYTQADGSFCAVVNYHGTFDAQAGQLAPGMGASNILNGSEDGRFDGGYRGVITGTLKANPAWRTRGMVGTTDYMCNIAGACPGYVSWMAQYFDAPSFTYSWWGWEYNSPKHGTWINACAPADGPGCPGSSGNIN